MDPLQEYFGLENSLNPHNAPVWLPYNTIDVILLELRDHQHDDKVYKQVKDIQISSSKFRFTYFVLQSWVC